MLKDIKEDLIEFSQQSQTTPVTSKSRCIAICQSIPLCFLTCFEGKDSADNRNLNSQVNIYLYFRFKLSVLFDYCGSCL